MLAGKLRYPVTIERPVDTRTPGGGFIRTWEAVSREWADIESISGSEFIAAQAVQAQTIYRIVLRYRPDLITSWHIREGTKVYEITAVLPDARRRRIELMCKTGKL
ncbi:phage head closure protein [Pseudomonas guariconensis]|uniref:phage head closure protein n=1 Tax=Pseudomonas guariconensis TaxID=1288410 RepID=UPI0025A9E2CB|nr:phage head closure protein [Pseudomonas guariconensis]MDM9609235.1 phage head closure protein [Pseudomonas guariconensis]MDM9614193.1 phage head closure protein [Pseudomonas guariconensis]